MKNNSFFISIVIYLILVSCATNKGVITIDDVSSEKILIIGVIEYDYTQLERKNISGIDLFVDSKEAFSDFKLLDNFLSSNKLKKQQFISVIGNKGEYELCFKKSESNSSEADNLLTNLDMERNMSSTQVNTLQKYIITDGKIINIGKVIVKYSGGTIENSRISYEYKFHTVNTDTVALFAFKQTYPDIYDKCKNEIYVFKNEFDTCIEYVLNHISEGKRLRINDYIIANPERTAIVFKNLTAETQDKFVEDIEKYTFEQLDEFLLNSE